jgi:hypothetical protein
VRVVFHFYADEHVRNHPRWDPDIELHKVAPKRQMQGPRRGTMEVVEFEPDRASGVDPRWPSRCAAAPLATWASRTRVNGDATCLGGRVVCAPLCEADGSVDTLKQLIEFSQNSRSYLRASRMPAPIVLSQPACQTRQAGATRPTSTGDGKPYARLGASAQSGRNPWSSSACARHGSCLQPTQLLSS